MALTIFVGLVALQLAWALRYSELESKTAQLRQQQHSGMAVRAHGADFEFVWYPEQQQ